MALLILCYFLNNLDCFTFENLDSAYKGMISGGISGLLSPRITEHETQSGKQTQLKWIFMKKVITV